MAESTPDPYPVHEPTFYLGGQPYVYERGSMDEAPELALAAIKETTAQLFRVWTSGMTGCILEEEGRCITKDEMRCRMAEMHLGIWELRLTLDLKPGAWVVPNVSYTLSV